MPKIIDPDDLNQGVEVIFTTSARTIEIVPFEVNASSNISSTGSSATNGVTFQCLYSFAKEEWRTDTDLIKFPFPFVSITEESFELQNDWDFVTGTTRELIRDGGWSLKDSGGTSTEEYMNVTSLGTFDSSASDLAYYLQVSGTSSQPTDMVFSGEVNQAVKIYGDASHGNFDYRDVFKLYLREQGKTYGFYDLLTEQNLTSLTFKKYALPLSNATDLNIDVADTGIDVNSDGTADTATYSGMSITYYATPQSRNIGGTNYDFSIIIDGFNQPKQQIYEFVQWSLRQIVDIDAGTGTTIGKVAEELLEFVGDTLKTKLTSDGGVYIDNFSAVDTNNLVFVDDTGVERTFPFVAAGNLQFNDNLVNDNQAVYRVFFTNDDAGDNIGRDFGTISATTIQDNSDVDIAGFVSGHTGGLIAFDYDYDNNVQRGNASSGTTVPYTAVAIGLDTAQYVITTGSIVRSTSNVINFVAALERNYSNP